MTRPQVIYIFILMLFLTCCGQTTYSDSKLIDVTAISSIEILKVTGPPDTVKCFWKHLTEEQVKSFSNKWNSSTDKQLVKYLPAFKIAIYFKNNPKREFRANGQFIKENNDWCIDFKDKGYFEKLYSDAKPKGDK